MIYLLQYEIAIRGAEKLRERHGTNYLVGTSAEILCELMILLVYVYPFFLVILYRAVFKRKEKSQIEVNVDVMGTK